MCVIDSPNIIRDLGFVNNVKCYNTIGLRGHTDI